MQRSALTRVLLSAAVLAAVLHLGARRIGPLPPLGAFLDPLHGVWAAAGGAELTDLDEVVLPGLAAPVRVVFDDRGVPHIFASTSEDAARALGYVVARDRLFQLEVRWRTAAGRMAELAGATALGFDRYVRGLGLAWSAERDFAALDPASPEAREIAAYAEGVNAWIDGLGPSDIPLEYHLLGVEPSPWEPVYSIYLAKLMGWDLTYGVTTDLRRRRLEALVGREAAAALSPVNSPIQQPIQPNGSTGPRFDFVPIAPPGEPDLLALEGLDDLAAALGPVLGDLLDDRASQPGPVLGSNNWAVAPERTAAGSALLAGDPHLLLTLPAIWYEAHLVVPGELDVYGVTIPSAPFVQIGFNRHVAWSFTNTGADVIDYYEEELDDRESPSRYLVDGEWRPLEVRVEQYRGHDDNLLATDTLYATHRGPLIAYEKESLAMRWTVLEEVGEKFGLWHAARAESVEEWLTAMEVWGAPAQNMIVADRQGTIAIRSTGTYPIHPDGSGLEIRDGRFSAEDWVGFWPLERYPSAVDPQQRYLASANQQPIDPRVDSTYMGADWPSPWRAMRINTLLSSDSAVTPDAMRRYQTDPGNARADLFLPFFLAAVRRQAEIGAPDESAVEAAELLAEWDRRYTKENRRAVVFEYAMRELADRTWDELLRPEGSRRVYTPSSTVLASLLHYPQSVWWDDRRTEDVVEDRDAILVAGLAAALVRAKRELGEPEGPAWRWENVRHANIYHLLELPALSALGLPVQGGPGNLNPSSGGGTHGASWRMVVELGDEISAWSIYPGGQSGHPLSSRYTDRIDKWVAGELDRVLFPRSESDLDDSRVTSLLELTPES
ncbi:MAG: penicillin acylase family protein [Gemmatimonadota bacterium]|nr:MAG: penicillin acylase family protein [Gemmatimonadota bacterium]